MPSLHLELGETTSQTLALHPSPLFHSKLVKESEFQLKRESLRHNHRSLDPIKTSLFHDPTEAEVITESAPMLDTSPRAVIIPSAQAEEAQITGNRGQFRPHCIDKGLGNPSKQ